MTDQAIVLLIGLLLAHYLGDFTPLSTARMQEAKMNGGPLSPIAGHAAVHAALVALTVSTLARPTWTLVVGAAAIEFGTHFAIDTARGRLGRLSPNLSDPARGVYWSVLGADQLSHCAVLVGVAAFVLGN